MTTIQGAEPSSAAAAAAKAERKALKKAAKKALKQQYAATETSAAPGPADAASELSVAPTEAHETADTASKDLAQDGPRPLGAAVTPRSQDPPGDNGNPAKKAKKGKKRSRPDPEPQGSSGAAQEEAGHGADSHESNLASPPAKKSKAPSVKADKPGKARKASKATEALAAGPWKYIESPALRALPQDTIAQFLESNKIKVKDSSNAGLLPILEFQHAGFPACLASVFGGFKAPTPIQAVCWPYLLKNKDVVGVAKTGSGKTLAFAMPALIHIYNLKQSRDAGGAKSKAKGYSTPHSVMISPTRELAMQIQDQVLTAGKPLQVTSACIYGGVPKWEQKKELERGVDVVVATPGRFMDLMDEGLIVLDECRFLVLDEADRMLDLGFQQDIKKIISQLPKQHQTVMFSATWPSSVRELASTYLNSPVQVNVGSSDLTANDSITQHVEVIEPFGKDDRIIALLKNYHNKKNRVLVFVLYKKEATRVEGLLTRKGYKVGSIHGDKSQNDRTKALNDFRDGRVPLLIATDVAARGLDIPEVEYVLNYTYPLTTEDYCHRIGRTGRAGATGISHTLFTFHDKAHSGSLINILKQAGQKVPEELLAFGTTVKKKEHAVFGAFFKDVDMSVKGSKITFDD